jgi:Fur family transcriptional regulator, ferric uptake regulator
VKRDSSHPPAADVLRDAGLRRTPVRAGVLEVLAAAGGPLGVPQILERLPEHTDAVTVYRTLNTFTRKKLVHRVHGEDRTWRYALSGGAMQSPAHQHPHFVCDECGTVECLEDASIPKTFVSSLRVGSRYSVRYPEVVLHGLCPKCHN